MADETRSLAEYNCLEDRGSGRAHHIYVKGKNVMALDVYAASQRGASSLDALVQSFGLSQEETLQAIRFCEWHRDQVEADLGSLMNGKNKLTDTDSSIYRVARILVPGLLFFVGILISLAFKGVFSIVVSIFCFILFLRFANEIPIFGWAWVKVFGRQDLWEWLRMTIGHWPLAS